MKTANKVIALFLMLISVICFFEALTFRGTAGVLPKVVFVGLFTSSFFLFFNAKEEEKILLRTNWKQWTITVLMLVLYFIAIVFIGFYVSTVFFIMLMMFIFGIHDIKILIALPLGFTATIYFIFSNFLGIVVPPTFFLE